MRTHHDDDDDVWFRGRSAPVAVLCCVGGDNNERRKYSRMAWDWVSCAKSLRNGKVQQPATAAAADRVAVDLSGIKVEEEEEE